MSPDGTLNLPAGDDQERYRLVRERMDVLASQRCRTLPDDAVTAVGHDVDPHGDATLLDACGRGR
jgi:hypothetical protein